MSLVSSIFGDAGASTASSKKKKNAGLKSLFDKSDEDNKKRLEEEAKNDAEEDGSSDSDSDSSDDDSSDDADDNNDNKDVVVDNNKTEVTAKNDDTKTTSKTDDATATTTKTKKPRKPKKEVVAEPEKGESKADDDTTKPGDEERTVFVGNLPLSTTRKSLAKVFSECGKVQSTRLRSVAVTGVKVPPKRAGDQNLVKKVCTFTKQFDLDAKSSVQGYVVFADKESVLKALALNNKALEDEDPKATRKIRRIRVDTASPTLDPKCSVFVGNLRYEADETTLADHFTTGCDLEQGDILGVRIIRDKETFQCKGFGYVLFQDSTMVATALQRMQDSLYMKRPLRVKVCGKSLKGRRGHEKEKKRHVPRPGSDGDTSNTMVSGDRSDPYSDNVSNKRQRGNDSAEGNGRGKTFNQSSGIATTVYPSASTLAKNAATPSPVEGAMRRVKKRNRRARGEKKKNVPPGAKVKPGISKRAASDAKVDKKVKKLEKRAAKGMGKTRK